MSIAVTLFVHVIRTIFCFWDVLSFPVYIFLYNPWEFKRRAKKIRSKITERTERSITVEPNSLPCELRDEILNQSDPIDTLAKVFDFAAERHRNKPCLGTRELLGEETEQQANGKTLKKVIQGDYHWKSYEEVAKESIDVGKGLYQLGIKGGEKLVIFADTRAEWMIMAIACFKSNISIVTLYTNLGEEGICYGINQTEVETIITSQELLGKLSKIIDKLPSLRRVIYFENKINICQSFPGLKSLQLIPYSNLLILGRHSVLELIPAGPEDLAILMYTSGSTGNPKGAMLTHSQLAANVCGCLSFSMNLLGNKRRAHESYIGYLPLAHIFELTMELCVILMGVRVGYSGPNTLIDSSSMIKVGNKGDASVLRPTTMVAVPVILDRIYKAMMAKIKDRGPGFEKFFQMCYNYRLFWVKQGFDRPILNRLIFSKFKMALGGNIEVFVGGGAPLSSEVHEFLRNCLCIRLAHGYGLTETAGGATLTDSDDLTTGKVGYPLPGMKIEIESWEEGGYTVHDKEGPRGELVIGCPWTAKGYYKMEVETRESFFEKFGLRWFKTGDIGQLMPDGTLKIVDRKKDLVKLQMGEYVSLGKVEAKLKVHPMVENVCVYADPTKSSTVALVVPDDVKLHEAAMKVLGSDNNTREELCANPKIVNYVVQSLLSHVKQLERFEIPKGVCLISDQWMPDTGLVTASMKLKRKNIQHQYQDVIDNLYSTNLNY